MYAWTARVDGHGEDVFRERTLALAAHHRGELGREEVWPRAVDASVGPLHVARGMRRGAEREHLSTARVREHLDGAPNTFKTGRPSRCPRTRRSCRHGATSPRSPAPRAASAIASAAARAVATPPVACCTLTEVPIKWCRGVPFRQKLPAAWGLQAQRQQEGARRIVGCEGVPRRHRPPRLACQRVHPGNRPRLEQLARRWRQERWRSCVVWSHSDRRASGTCRTTTTRGAGPRARPSGGASACCLRGRVLR